MLNSFFSSLTPPRAPSFLGAFSRVTFLSSPSSPSYPLNARRLSLAFLPAFGALAYIVQGSGGEGRGSLAWRLVSLENKKQKRHTGGINPSNVPINQILIYFEWKYITFLKGCLPYIFSSSKKTHLNE